MNRSSVEQEVMAVTKVEEDVPLGAELDETPEIAAFYTPSILHSIVPRHFSK